LIGGYKKGSVIERRLTAIEGRESYQKQFKLGLAIREEFQISLSASIFMYNCNNVHWLGVSVHFWPAGG